MDGPLRSKLQESTVSVLGIGGVYCRLKAKFNSWNCDAHELSIGNGILGDVFILHTDEVYDALIDPCADDT